MTIQDEIQRHRTALHEICAALGVRRLELFGSAVHSPSPRDLDFLAERVSATYIQTSQNLNRALPTRNLSSLGFWIFPATVSISCE